MANTLGELRVRTSFNPDKNALVDKIKQGAAQLINDINEIECTQGNGEQGRLKSLAMTEIESGAMWAVKAATSEQK